MNIDTGNSRWYNNFNLKVETDEKEKYTNTLISREQHIGGSAVIKSLWNGLLRADRKKKVVFF